MILARHNILELIGTRQNEFHSALLTCYSFDPIFFESFFLPQLRGIGIVNIVVMLDAGNYDRLLVDYPAYGLHKEAGNSGGDRLYSIVRQKSASNGVFHPKINLFIGQNNGMLVVGSGNLTYSGFSLNEEIWGAFSINGEESDYLPLFNTAWSYIRSRSDSKSILVQQQYRWMTDNSTWLSAHNSIANDEWVNTTDGKIRIIFNEPNRSILQQLDEIVGRSGVFSVDIVSPFIDADGRVIETLKERFGQADINCVYSKNGTYPLSYMKKTDRGVSFYEWADVFQDKRNHTSPLHAKIFQFRGAEATVLVLGSANLTTAALSGRNDEACIVLVSHNPRDFFVELGIELSPQAVSSQAVIGNLPDKTTYENKSSRTQQIFSSETIDGRVICNTNMPDGIALLGLIDGAGETIATKSVNVKNGKIVLDGGFSNAIIVVAIDQSGKEISNRCFIAKEETVARFNPNQTLRKLESLLEASINWNADLTPILSYISFESSAGHRKAACYSADNASKSNNTAGDVIEKEAFDNIDVAGSRKMLNMPSIRIMDILLESLREHKCKESNSEGADDIPLNNSAIEDGCDIKEAVTLKQRKEVAEVELSDCIDKYGNRLSKYYSNRLENFYKAADEWGNGIFKDPNLEYEDVTAESFSHILIHAILLWKELATNSTAVKYSQISQYLHNLGQFSLLSGGGYTVANDYASRKTVEAHRNLIVYTLLIISKLRFSKNISQDGKLTILNLFDSFRQNPEISVEQIKELFSQKLQEEGVDVKSNMLSFIEQTICEYDFFNSHRSDSATVRLISNFEGEYLYKKNIGFVYGTDFEYYTDKNGEQGCKYLLLHPGFRTPVSFVGRLKIKALF